MSKLIMTRGIPASGKSTWAKNWVAEAEVTGQRVRVNRDDLRHQLFNSYWGSDVDEQTVTLAQTASVTAFLTNGKDVVLDNTNLKARDVRENMRLAHKLGATVEFKDFPIDVDEAINRDWSRRARGERSVGADVILNFKRFLAKDGSLPPVPLLTEEDPRWNFKPYVPGDVPAMSFDIDGTLAHMNGRGPYDSHLYHTDTVDTNVLRLLLDAVALGYEIIILTGRSADHRAEVMRWLRHNNIPFDKLFMRPSSEPQTNDAIIKSELVDEHISGVYDIVMHYDDRNRVVDALRAKGMKVAQVEPGDF